METKKLVELLEKFLEDEAPFSTSGRQTIDEQIESAPYEAIQRFINWIEYKYKPNSKVSRK